MTGHQGSLPNADQNYGIDPEGILLAHHAICTAELVKSHLRPD